jgi:hypothetical protein
LNLFRGRHLTRKVAVKEISLSGHQFTIFNDTTGEERISKDDPNSIVERVREIYAHIKTDYESNIVRLYDVVSFFNKIILYILSL